MQPTAVDAATYCSLAHTEDVSRHQRGFTCITGGASPVHNSRQQVGHGSGALHHDARVLENLTASVSALFDKSSTASKCMQGIPAQTESEGTPKRT